MTEPIRNRIVGTGLESPESLLANPRNWRVHPMAQEKALGAVLDEVGWVQNVIVNQRTGHVVDGHLRVALAISRGEASVPVVFVDLDENEEGLVLATIDPLSAMAGTDKDLLAQLLGEVSAEGVGLVELLSDAGLGIGVDDADFPVLPAGERGAIRTITFTLTAEQEEGVKDALARAKAVGPFMETGNENSNGNALARIAETYQP